MTPKIKIKLVLLLAFLTIVITGCRCTLLPSAEEKQKLQPISLRYWRVWDSPSNFNGILSAYSAVHPNISISMQILRYEEFEKKLLEAYADQKPPDIISLHYAWLPKYVDKKYITPLPSKISMAYQYKQTTMGIKEETIIELKNTPIPTLTQLKNDFIETVSNDIVIDNKIYGLPLSLDTMVLYYNRDLLDKARIPVPPTNWEEFQSAVKKITALNEKGGIEIAGAALGTADNILRSPDILMLLMKQSGASIIKNGTVQFTSSKRAGYNPGLVALQFYTDFSNPQKEVYSWNNEMPDSLRAFADKKLAFYFGYAYDLPSILSFSRNTLNLGITKMPQLQQGEPEANIANYWVETVSSRSKYINEAWDFILFETSKKQVESYLKSTKKPTALRALVETQLKDEKMNIFASQLLTSQSWYHGKDINAAEEVIKDMINNVNAGQDPAQSLNMAAQRVQQTIN